MWWRSYCHRACALRPRPRRLPAAASSLSTAGLRPAARKLAEVMAAVEIDPIPGRVGQRVRNELIFANTGGNYAAPQKYRLDIVVKESVTDQLVQITGDATGQVYELNATFKLVDVSNGKVLLVGKRHLARAL